MSIKRQAIGTQRHGLESTHASFPEAPRTSKRLRVSELEERTPAFGIPCREEPADEADHHLATPLLPGRPNPGANGATARAALTVMSGKDAGRTFVLGDRTTLGRNPCSDVPIDEPSASWNHARILAGPNGDHVLEDLGSTNGTFVRGRQVTLEPLRAGDRVQLGESAVLRFSFVDASEETLSARLYESAIRDPLTGALNRRYLMDALETATSRARMSGSDIFALMLDVDHFKRFNDTHGHLAGDRALCFMVARASRELDRGDLLARYGGEEFLVVREGGTLRGALGLAERIRMAIEGLAFAVGGYGVGTTVSIGVGSLRECEEDETALGLIARADERLYVAKASGRNRVHGPAH